MMQPRSIRSARTAARVPAAALLLLLAGGCASFWSTQPPTVRVSSLPPPAPTEARTEARTDGAAAPGSSARTAADAKPDFVELKPFTAAAGKAPPPAREQLPFSATEMVTASSDALPLPRFLDYVFGDLLQVNYVVDAQVAKLQTPVSLNVKQPVSQIALYDLAVNALKLHSVKVVRRGSVFYVERILAQGEAPVGVGASPEDVPATGGEVRQIIPLAYADANAVKALLPTVGALTVTVAPNENSLVVQGDRAMVLRFLETVRALDRPSLRGRHVGLLPVTFLDPAALAEKLKEVLTNEGIPVSSGAGKSGLYLSPVESPRALLVFSPEAQWLARARYWAGILDVASGGEGRQYFVYLPRNRKATELGETIDKLLHGSPGGTSGRRRTDRATTARSRSDQPAAASGAAVATPAIAGAQPAAIGAIAPVGGEGSETQVVVDEGRNALIFLARPSEYESIRRVLASIDNMPVQVAIEATIAEVTLTDNLSLGIEWSLRSTAGALTQIAGTAGGLGLGGAGFNYSIVSDSGNFEAFLNALSQQNRVRILSTPRLMVRDGKAASISVGTEVPIVTSEATNPDIQVGGTTGILRSVQYRATGVMLSVTPSVNAEGLVTLTLGVEVSEAQTNTTSDISSPIILNRTVSTEVVAGNAQTVLLGGLIRSNRSQGASRVPLLGDLPLFGWLFRTQSKGSTDTELVILLTPRILGQIEAVDGVRDAVLQQLNLIEAVKGE